MSDITNTPNVEVVTPEQAAVYLQTVDASTTRKLSDSQVSRYSADMLQGNWHISQPLIFSDSGKLLDGQHRLAAVVKANTPVEFSILRGVGESSI